MKLLYLCLFSFAITMAEERNLDQILKDGNNQFTAKMFSQVAESNPGKSIVLSAFSVMPPLAQLALASVGSSQDEILNAIGMPNDNTTETAISYANTNLRSTKGVELKTASKIYIAERFELNTDFAAVSRNVFDSEFENINFYKNQEAADEINAWVEDQTNHRIKDLVKPETLSEDTRAVLVNAIYFKGFWSKRFQRYSTIDRNFYVTTDKVVQISMMYNKEYYKYTESLELNAQILEIQYEGGEASCVFVLPREIDGINKLEEKLKDPTVLDKATENMLEWQVEVFLPKFKIETTTNLKDILKKMKVTKMFSPDDAGLEKLLKNTKDLYISSAWQKVFIEINEEGAEAAAANVFVIDVMPISVNNAPNPSVLFFADRPFYFAVKSKSLTLFNGVLRGV